jgi:hypothetical protein
VRRNFSHEDYRSEHPTERSSDRAFGCTVGTVLVVLGAGKGFLAGTVTPVSFLLAAAGAALVLFWIVSPSRLAGVNRLWLQLGVLLSKIVNPIVLAVLFYVAVTPMALVMRMAGRRPLRLTADPAAPSYWIAREPAEGGPAAMRRQF